MNLPSVSKIALILLALIVSSCHHTQQAVSHGEFVGHHFAAVDETLFVNLPALRLTSSSLEDPRFMNPQDPAIVPLFVRHAERTQIDTASAISTQNAVGSRSMKSNPSSHHAQSSVSHSFSHCIKVIVLIVFLLIMLFALVKFNYRVSLDL